MIAVTEKPLSELVREIEAECGTIYMEERNYKFTHDKKDEIFHILLEEKRLPELSFPIEKVSYLDGCKVYFQNGGWISARFSGTEPLLRLFSEMPQKEDAAKICKDFEDFLEIKQ